VRDYAAKVGLDAKEALASGLEEKSKEFSATGEIYVPVKSAE
jgi:hypothetical protein